MNIPDSALVNKEFLKNLQIAYNATIESRINNGYISVRAEPFDSCPLILSIVEGERTLAQDRLVEARTLLPSTGSGRTATRIHYFCEAQ